MTVLARTCPDWRSKVIHESSPILQGLSALLRHDCPGYLMTYLYPGVELGAAGPWDIRCEDIERQTFPDGAFDIVITQDVLEHVYHPDKAHQEIHRTLRPGGVAFHTFPIYKDIVQTRCVAILKDGAPVHLEPPEYHGDPVALETGALVTYRYGYDIGDVIAGWAPFDVEVTRFNDRTRGILGEFTEVVTCRKR